MTDEQETNHAFARSRSNVGLGGASDLDILRRIAERGLKLAQAENPKFIDIFQHMLDEITRVPPNVELRGATLHQRPARTLS